MKRNIQTLKEKQYDVLILGGGIHGATIACECARAGLSTALIDKNDFGHATSANSLKILHGGLRYLQHLNVKRMRHSIVSRRQMFKQAPHSARPLRCLIPNHGKGIHGNFLMRIALLLNDLISWDRNRGLAKESHLPSGKILSRNRLLQLFPEIVKEKTTGATVWYDAVAINSERLTLSFVQEAAHCGASVANYVEAKELLQAKDGIHEVRARDCFTGDAFHIQARCIVNSCGPWGDGVFAASEDSTTSWAKAVNIVVKKELFPGYAVGLKGETQFEDKDSIIKKKGRFFFFVPWRGYTMIGTTYKPYVQSPDQLLADCDDVDEMVSMVNDIYPPAKLRRSDVTFAHAGLVPMSEKSNQDSPEVQLEKESVLIDHATLNSAMAGVYSVKGVKYTTAPRVASDLRKKVCQYLGVAPSGIKASVSSCSKSSGNESSKTLSFLVSRYGKGAALVQEYVEKDTTYISQEPLFTRGEIRYMVEEEMACKLSDIIFRRSELGTAEAPASSALEEIASNMAELLQWDRARKQLEISEVLAVFPSWQNNE